MKERPILFSAPMIRALLDGTKTQTRRIVKPQPDEGGRVDVGEMGASLGVAYIRSDRGGQCVRVPCPYGQPGDLLWVRETVQGWSFDESGESVVRYVADGAFRPIENTQYAADKWLELYNYADKKGAKVPSIHMPRWASRITLKITGVRVERLNDISDEDALAEGVYPTATGLYPGSPRAAYRGLWESISGPGSWDAKPWVWVIEFKRVLS